MRLYFKRKVLRVLKKNSDNVADINAGLCWDLDFKKNKD